jgi:hypothetical protein
MQGPYAQDQFAQLPNEFRLDRVIPLKVPGVSAPRHLALIRLA